MSFSFKAREKLTKSFTFFKNLNLPEKFLEKREKRSLKIESYEKYLLNRTTFKYTKK